MTFPPLFASCFPYALIKNARALGELRGGPEAEIELIKHNERLRGGSKWPCYRTMAELDHVEPAALVSDASGSISQSRSRMAGRFLTLFEGACDVWLTCDDDIYCGREVLARTIALARETREIATVPYLLRDGRTSSVTGLAGATVATTGFGLVALHRNAVERIASLCALAVDDKGSEYPAIFLEYLDEKRRWLGEDIAFCHRATAAEVTMHVVFDAPICHAGRWSRLDPGGTFSVDRATAAGAA